MEGNRHVPKRRQPSRGRDCCASTSTESATPHGGRSRQPPPMPSRRWRGSCAGPWPSCAASGLGGLPRRATSPQGAAPRRAAGVKRRRRLFAAAPSGGFPPPRRERPPRRWRPRRELAAPGDARARAARARASGPCVDTAPSSALPPERRPPPARTSCSPRACPGAGPPLGSPRAAQARETRRTGSSAPRTAPPARARCCPAGDADASRSRAPQCRPGPRGMQRPGDRACGPPR
mmetsp:Transcript_82419/g.260128  ORF Transcript_82419/g.260128 Transcript_82419/m.260128 type:complete len:234 (+) Transcript_82419:74-775(+)